MSLAIGLISGTSMDGIDAVLVEWVGAGLPVVYAHRTDPYSRLLQVALRACADAGSVADAARLNVAVGEEFANAACRLLADAGVPAEQIACIGSHGQTLVHLPEPETIGRHAVRCTVQIGEAAVIAERTGITTVCDFRVRDMAVGGQGAPLVAWLDHLVYAHPEHRRVLLNLGGIANITVLQPGGSVETVVAFDTGPANALLDAACRHRGVAAGLDEGGSLSASGRTDAALLARLLAHPFYARQPPKSADIGIFLREHAEACWQAAQDASTPNLLRTLVELTARTVGDAVEQHAGGPVDEVLVAGGGLHNQTLFAALRDSCAPAEVRPASDVAAIPPDAKEAVTFALLGLECLAGHPGNVPAATGAAKPVVLGKIVPA